MHGLKPRELALLSVFQTNEDRWGEIRLTMEELTALTNMSRTTLWRALTELTERGLIKTTRTKRNFGKWYKNVYKLIKGETKGETSTTGQVDNDKVISLTTSTSHTMNINTSYLYSLGRVAPLKGIKMVNKWVDEDEGMMAFGSLETQKRPEKIKKIPATRHLRPQNEWTANDMAAEFTYRAYDKIRGIPAMVNTRSMAIALAQYRKKYGTTAADEIRAMDKFFVEEKNLLAMKRFPKRSAGIFLNYLTQNIAETSDKVTIEQAIAMEDELEYIYASDGRKFVKSMSGRQELAEYEEGLL